MESFKGYRTILVNAFLAIPLVFDYVAAMLTAHGDQIREVVPEIYQDEYAFLIVLVNLWLRFKTTTPVGRAE